MKNEKIRQSNFELLRIVCIVLIAMMHTSYKAFATTSVANQEVLLAINTLTNTGVDIFVLLSGYFGIRFRKERLIGIVCLVLFYSLLCFCADRFILGKHLPMKECIPYLFPILSRKWWFISCYVVLYCCSKWINDWCESMSEKDCRDILMVLAFFFVVAPTVLIFYELTNDYGKGMVNMFFVYLLGRYIRRFGLPQFIVRHTWALLLVSLLLIFIGNSILTLAGHTVILRFARDNSLFILCASVCIMHLFSRMTFTSKVINYLATMVLGLYLSNETIIGVVLCYLPIENINTIDVWSHLGIVLMLVSGLSISIELIRKQITKVVSI